MMFFMGCELSFSKLFRKSVAGKVACIESPITGTGIPDTVWGLKSGRTVWLELKYMEAWPVRATTRTDLGLKVDQALFLYNWAKNGSGAYVFAQVGRDYLLFEGSEALRIVKGLQKHELYSIVYASWFSRMDWEDLEKLV